MNDFIIVTDSCCDLTQEIADKYDLVIVPLTLNFSDKSCKNYLDGREIQPKELYRRLSEGELPTTSAVNIGEFEEIFEPIIEEGKDILYIGFSSGLSGTYSSGKTALSMLSEKYPERKLLSVDSLCASLGQGLLVYLTAQLKETGKTIEEVKAYVEESIPHLCHWFTVNDLFHLQRGGRVSAAVAIVGSVLGIKPVLHVDNEGHLTSVSKARGRKAAINALFDKISNTGIDVKNQSVFISHGDCEEEAKQLGDRIVSELGAKEVIINYVGPVIGAHAGCGVLALFYLGTER